MRANDYLEREVDTSLSGGGQAHRDRHRAGRKGSMLLFDEPEAGIDLRSFARLTEIFSALYSKREATMIIRRLKPSPDPVSTGGCASESAPSNEPNWTSKSMHWTQWSTSTEHIKIDPRTDGHAGIDIHILPGAYQGRDLPHSRRDDQDRPYR